MPLRPFFPLNWQYEDAPFARLFVRWSLGNPSCLVGKWLSLCFHQPRLSIVGPGEEIPDSNKENRLKPLWSYRGEVTPASQSRACHTPPLRCGSLLRRSLVLISGYTPRPCSVSEDQLHHQCARRNDQTRRRPLTGRHSAMSPH
jgi:hypothetical protein